MREELGILCDQYEERGLPAGDVCLLREVAVSRSVPTVRFQSPYYTASGATLIRAWGCGSCGTLCGNGEGFGLHYGERGPIHDGVGTGDGQGGGNCGFGSGRGEGFSSEEY